MWGPFDSTYIWFASIFDSTCAPGLNMGKSQPLQLSKKTSFMSCKFVIGVVYIQPYGVLHGGGERVRIYELPQWFTSARNFQRQRDLLSLVIVTVATVEQEPFLSYFQCNSRSLSGHNPIRNATKISKSRLLSLVDCLHWRREWVLSGRGRYPPRCHPESRPGFQTDHQAISREETLLLA